MSKKEDNLENLRHSLAHLLAASVLKHFPEAMPTIGPVIDSGFYYDFDFSKGETPTEKDLEKIERSMRELLPSWSDFEEKEVSAEEAKEYFKNNPYKIELIEELEKEGQKITFYTSGEFTDLCRGGHLEKPNKEVDPKAFKLTSIAGAYWRGDENKTMLTRVYGTAFQTKEELDAHTKQKEQAQERDHRKLGQELELFTISPLVGSGLPLFTPKGTAMRDAIVSKIQKIQKKYGYKGVAIPHITKPDLYKVSGHWDKFGEELFKVKGKDSDFVIKPMNCPHHTQIYSAFPKSYKDLPVRYTETTMVYRDEQSGELLGLSRVRSITQDDGHVFCTPDQIEEEIEIIAKVIKEFYESLSMWNDGDFWVSLSVRDLENKDGYLGDDKLWDEAENTLEEIAKKLKLPYKRTEGEAAFYGPKLDFMFKDAIGREWQLATAQLDFVMPERFKLNYTDKDGTKKTPVMIHRAIAGSLERFMSIIIEHFAGAFPTWLSPIQIAILPIGEKHKDYAKKVSEELEERGLRVEINSSDDSLGKKISAVRNQKIPYWAVIGDEEVSIQKITLESRDEGKIGQVSIEETISKILE